MHLPHTFSRLARGALGFMCAGALMAGPVGVAWADEGDASWAYPVPTQATEIDHNLVTFGSQGDIWGEVLGISDVARNMWSDYNEDGTPNAEGISSDIVVQLFGSDVNVNPNPYYTNLIYNANAAEADRVDHYNFADKSGLGTGIDRADNTLVDAYGGISATMSYRPNIVMGNCATGWQDPGAILLRSDGTTPVGVGSYNTTISAGYDPQVTTIRGFKKGSDYYRAGDNAYNPYYVENLSMYGDVAEAAAKVGTTDVSSYGIGTDIHNALTVGSATIGSTYAQMYRILDAIEGVMAENPSLTTRYGDPAAIAAQYESYGRGLQHYVLSKIADGTLTKKKVAVVSDVNTTENTVTLYKSSPSNTIDGTASSFGNAYKTMEAVENVTENIAGTYSTDPDTLVQAGWSKGYANTKVVEDVSELKQADVIILTSSSYEASLKQVFEAAGIADADIPPMFVNFAASANRGVPGFPALGTDGLERMAALLGFVYPEAINPVYAMAYYYTQFYHVKSDVDTLSNVLNYNIENMTLPAGVTGDLAGYSDDIIQNAINAGLQYYANNKELIDTTYPKLKTTEHVVLPDTDAVAADKAAVDAVLAKIQALNPEAVTANDAAVAEARSAYNALTDNQKVYVRDDDLAALKAAEAAVVTATKIKDAEDAAAAASAAKDAADQEAAKAKEEAAKAQENEKKAQQATAKAQENEKKAQQKANASTVKNNPMKASGKTVTAKAKKATKITKAKAFKISKAQGKVIFIKKSGNKKITVSTAGKITVKKGLKKGNTYKVKVNVIALGNSKYKSKTTTVTVKVKVK